MTTIRKINKRRRFDSARGQHPRAIERKYRQELQRRMRLTARVTEEGIDEILRAYGDEIDALARGDSEAGIVRAITREIIGIRLAVQGLWTDREITDFATEIAGQVDMFETRQTARQWSSVMGVDPLFGDRLTQSLIREFSMQNLRLIKDIPDQFLSQVQDGLVDAVRRGQRAETFQGVIQERLGVAESRAKLIARDQIGSIASGITETRQRELGVTRYRWSTSQDERVVGNPSGLYPEATNPEMHGNHWEREGQIFEWSDPPEDGHPGRAIQCRCTADPVVDDLL